MPKPQLDKTDYKILSFLGKNARMPFLEIARECGVSGAAIHQRVKKLEESGVIAGSRIEIAPRSLGYSMCAFIGIRFSDPNLHFTAVEALKKIPEVVECHFITGKYNMLIKVYCTDNEHFMHLIFDDILKIEGVFQTETFLSLQKAFDREIDVMSLHDTP